MAIFWPQNVFFERKIKQNQHIEPKWPPNNGFRGHKSKVIAPHHLIWYHIDSNRPLWGYYNIKTTTEHCRAWFVDRKWCFFSWKYVIVSYSENIWGVKNDFFFQMELEKRVCGLIWYSLLFLYHIDPYLSPEPFYSLISTLDQKLVVYWSWNLWKFLT